MSAPLRTPVLPEPIHESRRNLVFRCQDADTGAPAVVKRLKPEARSAATERRLRWEYELLARANGQLPWQAMAHEVAGLLYQGDGLSMASRAHLQAARTAHAQWGAVAKVRGSSRPRIPGSTRKPGPAKP